MSTTRSLTLEIDGESYALDKIPAEQSAVVLAKKDKLLKAIDLKTLADDLGRVGGFIRIAYNGVGAAGPKFTNEQIQIQRLGYDITKLCDKSALTLGKFKKASTCILTDLQSTYKFLLDNMEELALDTLSAVSKLAGDMQKAALELNREFEEEEKKVTKTLEDTQKSKGDEAMRIQELKKEQVKMEEEKQEALKLMKEHQQKENEAESRRIDLEQQEYRLIVESGKTKYLKEIVNFITTIIYGVKVFSVEEKEKKAEAIRQLRREVYETEQAIGKKRHESLARMTLFTAKIKQCQEEENMADCAVEALHEAIGTLKELSAVMMRVAQFWEQMQDHCKCLAESEMKSLIENAIANYSEEKRLKIWTSSAFKHKAVQFYAGWVALHGVCNVYMEQLKVTQSDLYHYITENPTHEQSRSNLKELVENFLGDLQRDQKAFSDKTLEAQEKIKLLGDSGAQCIFRMSVIQPIWLCALSIIIYIAIYVYNYIN